MAVAGVARTAASVACRSPGLTSWVRSRLPPHGICPGGDGGRPEAARFRPGQEPTAALSTCGLESHQGCVFLAAHCPVRSRSLKPPAEDLGFEEGGLSLHIMWLRKDTGSSRTIGPRTSRANQTLRVQVGFVQRGVLLGPGDPGPLPEGGPTAIG